MKADCILAIGQVLGRQPSDADIRNIEDRISRAMRQEAAADPGAWLARPVTAQVRAGAQRAAQELVAESARKQELRVKQVLATARVQQIIAAFPGTQLEAVDRLLAHNSKTMGSITSIDSQATAIEATMIGRMSSLLEAHNPKFLGLLEDEKGLRDIIRELHGESTGNKDAAGGAKIISEQVFEPLRQRLNNAGADIGKLDDYGVPHHHSQLRVARAGRDAWVKYVLPRLNRRRYVRENGSPMSEVELTAFLSEAWKTIAHGGANKREPGQYAGSGARAKRRDHSRQIHFKSADDYIDYQGQFGERTLYEIIIGHVHGMSRDIALVENLGPNPEQTFRLFLDRAEQTALNAEASGFGDYAKTVRRLENLYDEVSGNTKPVASARMGQFFDGVRNLQVFAKLGSSAITALSDEGTMRVAAHVNNLPEMQLMANELRAYTSIDQRRLARRAGLALNTMAMGINRFAQEQLGKGWTAKAAQFTTRAGGLNFTTDARRAAWGVTQMSALGHVAATTPSLSKLDPVDHRILLSKGLTEADFAVWKRAQQEDWGNSNNTMLTPESIYRIPDEQLAGLGNPQQLREQAATKLLALVLEETDIAIIQPGARERAMMYGNTQRGTFKGELTRSVLLFKSFPITMITKQIARGMSQKTGAGRAAYLVTLTAATTAFGMLALQANQITNGKDPRDMKDWETWLHALLKGGALSLYGDLLLNDETQYGHGPITSLAGPVVGTAEDAWKLTFGNIHQAARGEDPHVGAEAVQLLKTNLTPNLWYSKAAIDHMFLHQLQETLSPDYLRKMRRRAEREFGESYWWAPGDVLPERAPDPAAAVGEN